MGYFLKISHFFGLTMEGSSEVLICVRVFMGRIHIAVHGRPKIKFILCLTQYMDLAQALSPLRKVP